MEIRLDYLESYINDVSNCLVYLKAPDSKVLKDFSSQELRSINKAYLAIRDLSEIINKLSHKKGIIVHTH